MRIASKFIFVHIPKTGGTWMREALERVYLDKFFNESLIGRLLGKLRLIMPAKYVENRVAPLMFFEYSHHNTNELTKDLLDTPPYARRSGINLLLRFLLWAKLWKQPDVLGLLLTHTRINQLPKELVSSRESILVPLSHPLRWHISRYNYYRKRLPGNKHAADICKLIGEFQDFNDYMNKQMMQMQKIYYSSYMAYINQRGEKHKQLDGFKYPTEVMTWLEKSSLENEAPQHYGLLSWFFIWFLLPNPHEILSLSAQDYATYISSDEFRQQMRRFTFLPTQNLNQSTYDFLLNNGYQEKAIAAIQNMQPVNRSTQADKYSLYYNREQLEEIYALEKIVFNAIPAYQAIYDKALNDL